MAGFDHYGGLDDYGTSNDGFEFVDSSFVSGADHRALPAYMRNTFTSSVNQAAGEAVRGNVLKKHRDEYSTEHSHSMSHVSGSPLHISGSKSYDAAIKSDGSPGHGEGTTGNRGLTRYRPFGSFETEATVKREARAVIDEHKKHPQWKDVNPNINLSVDLDKNKQNKQKSAERGKAGESGSEIGRHQQELQIEHKTPKNQLHLKNYHLRSPSHSHSPSYSHHANKHRPANAASIVGSGSKQSGSGSGSANLTFFADMALREPGHIESTLSKLSKSPVAKDRDGVSLSGDSSNVNISNMNNITVDNSYAATPDLFSLSMPGSAFSQSGDGERGGIAVEYAPQEYAPQEYDSNKSLALVGRGNMKGGYQYSPSPRDKHRGFSNSNSNITSSRNNNENSNSRGRGLNGHRTYPANFTNSHAKTLGNGNMRSRSGSPSRSLSKTQPVSSITRNGGNGHAITHTPQSSTQGRITANSYSATTHSTSPKRAINARPKTEKDLGAIKRVLQGQEEDMHRVLPDAEKHLLDLESALRYQMKASTKDQQLYKPLSKLRQSSKQKTVTPMVGPTQVSLIEV
mgnify:CR=1 FL=1